MMDDPPMPSVEKIRDLLKVLEEEIPGLLEKLIKVLYDPEESQNIGKAVGNFYKELKEAGMGDETASRITAMYASNLSIRGMMKGMRPMGMGRPMWGPPMGMHRYGSMPPMPEEKD